MTEWAVGRFTALMGIGAAVLALIAFAVFGSLSAPTQSDSGEQIAAFFADNRMTMAIIIYLVSLSFGLNLAFYVGLRDVLKRRAPDMETLSTVGTIAGIVFVAVVFTGFGVLLQLVYREGAGDPATQRTLFDIYSLNVTMTGVPTAISMTAISAVIVRSGAMPQWLGWSGFVVGGAHFVSMGSLARDGFFTPDIVAGQIAPLMFYAWLLVLSIVLFIKPTAQAAH